jgi:hypothetical protein
VRTWVLALLATTSLLLAFASSGLHVHLPASPDPDGRGTDDAAGGFCAVCLHAKAHAADAIVPLGETTADSDRSLPDGERSIRPSMRIERPDLSRAPPDTR